MLEAKKAAYARRKERIFALCAGETVEVALMASVSCILLHEMEGFLYREVRFSYL